MHYEKYNICPLLNKLKIENSNLNKITIIYLNYI